jgi:hypothetical protein
MCYQKLANGIAEKRALSKNEKKKNCKTSRLGCPSCDERVCKDCWAEGYDMHKKKLVVNAFNVHVLGTKLN